MKEIGIGTAEGAKSFAYSDRDDVKVSINNKLVSASEEGACLIVTDFFGEYSIWFYAIGWDQTEYLLDCYNYILK